MQVEDLDQKVLRIGSDAKPDQPWSEWRDMHGNRWSMSATQQWIPVQPES